MIGVGKRSDDPALKELLLVADRCGKDPVHLAVEKLEEERVRPISSFSNTGHTSGPRRLKYWVESCSEVLPGKDSFHYPAPVPKKPGRQQLANPTLRVFTEVTFGIPRNTEFYTERISIPRNSA